MLRVKALAVVVVGIGFFVAGCSSEKDCNQTPLLATQSNLPSSCSFKPGSTLSLQVRWCSCGTSTACKVYAPEQGYIQVEPRVQACDASCDLNQASCGRDITTCEIAVPSTEDTYHLTVISGSDGASVDVPLHVSSGANNGCS